MSKIFGKEKDAANLDAIEIYYEVITCPVDGIERIVPTGHHSVDNFTYSMGQNVVTVAYDPSRPERYIVLEQEGSIAMGVLCVAPGAVFAMVPLIS